MSHPTLPFELEKNKNKKLKPESGLRIVDVTPCDRSNANRVSLKRATFVYANIYRVPNVHIKQKMALFCYSFLNSFLGSGTDKRGELMVTGCVT